MQVWKDSKAAVKQRFLCTSQNGREFVLHFYSIFWWFSVNVAKICFFICEMFTGTWVPGYRYREGLCGLVVLQHQLEIIDFPRGIKYCILHYLHEYRLVIDWVKISWTAGVLFICSETAELHWCSEILKIINFLRSFYSLIRVNLLDCSVNIQLLYDCMQ